jgi:hypothetical protein
MFSANKSAGDYWNASIEIDDLREDLKAACEHQRATDALEEEVASLLKSSEADQAIIEQLEVAVFE